ncbi:rod shape-determining protein RodA [Limnobacter humi]|uniref:Peptidoglycan glycosyltransferase MrdB n=1 Tax=Limnobacter humi TaxID=1778671 RepID=A0ABT1WD09_9BURK|nr:rod shape-determining protein RodA [Limnobacter humi]MCQ8895407.1 rod shape-determining protein RodA [Limnobacter humi]
MRSAKVNRSIQREPLWPKIKPYLSVFDPALSIVLLIVMLFALVVQYSAAYNFEGRMADHLRNFMVAFLVMWATANLKPQFMMRVAPPLYILGVILLIAVELFGDISKGAQRWLNLGFVRIQPSEIMKIAMPLMLAWFFQQRENVSGWREFVVATVLLGIPGVLILKQPDLGTAMLVFASGFFVIFFAGLSWRVMGGLLLAFLASLPVLWNLMHDYQRQRVLTLIDPTLDPLGKGFHIIQSTVAVGSGGFTGKGFLQGTQTHLEFIPERTTDFIFAVLAEEFGLLGALVLLLLYTCLIIRGLTIAANAPTLFSRLLAGAISLIFFVYGFVNIGMVSGILPVVGVPLPMMSYGGTAMVTLGMGAGILMSINHNKKLVQT